MVLNCTQVVDWCRRTGSVVVRKGVWVSPHLGRSAGRSVDLSCEGATPPKLLALARDLAHEAGLLGNQRPGDEAAIWLHQVWLWDPVVDQTGWSLLRGLWNLEASEEYDHCPPAKLLRRTDPDGLIVASIALPLLFQWDASLIRLDGTLMAHISHDRYVSLFAATLEDIERVEREFRQTWRSVRSSPEPGGCAPE